MSGAGDEAVEDAERDPRARAERAPAAEARGGTADAAPGDAVDPRGPADAVDAVDAGGAPATDADEAEAADGAADGAAAAAQDEATTDTDPGADRVPVAGGGARWRVHPALAHAALLGCVVACAVLLGERAIRTPDAYFHLHVGREILRERAVPRANHYLAIGQGAPFVDVEWGFQVAVAWLDARAGLEGPIALRNALALLATLLVYGLASARGGGRAAPGALAAALFLLVASPRFLLAPEALSLALLALSAALLAARARWPRAVWALPAVALVWANAHGFWALLPALVAIALADDLARGRGARLAVILALVLGAAWATPYGADGFLYPFRVALDREGRALIEELVVELGSPLADPRLRRTFEARAGLALAALAATAGGWLAWRERSLERALAGALALALGLGYLRNLGLFAVLAAPLAAEGVLALAGAAAARLARGGPPPPLVGAVRGAATGLLGFALLYGAWSTGSLRGERRQLEAIGLGPRFAPAIDHDAAIAFYLDGLGAGFPAVLWNDFSTGHALLERSGGRLTPVLCGQTDLARPALAAYARALSGQSGLDALLALVPADAFFVDHRRLAGSALLDELAAPDGPFRLVYLDGRSAIFLRRSDRLRAAGERYEVDLDAVARDPDAHLRFADEREGGAGRPRPWVEALYRHGILARPPARPRDRLEVARLLLSTGRAEGARRLAERAAEQAPGWAPVDFVLGLALRDLGQLDRAKDHLRRAARALGDAAEPYHALGLVHLRLGELGRAEEAIARALALDPASAVYRTNLDLVRRLGGKGGDEVTPASAADPAENDRAEAIRCYNEATHLAAEGRTREAERLYRRALALVPDFADAHYNLGNLLFRAERLGEAALAYKRAVSLRPDDAEARYFLALALAELGRPAEALTEVEQLLARDPAHAAARRLAERLAGGPRGR